MNAPATRAAKTGTLAALVIICSAWEAAAPATPESAVLPASTVDAARPGSTEDIRDIRGPQSLLPASLMPALAAGGAMLALGVYGAWRLLRRRRPDRAPLPFEVALQRLEGARALMQPPSARVFSTAVSDIVRSYIEQGFDLTATHRTTEEFLRDLTELPDSPLARYRPLLATFLEQCDLVKFGDMSLTLQSMESLHRSACDFVRATVAPEESARIRTAGPLHEDRQAHDSLPST